VSVCCRVDDKVHEMPKDQGRQPMAGECYRCTKEILLFLVMQVAELTTSLDHLRGCSKTKTGGLLLGLK